MIWYDMMWWYKLQVQPFNHIRNMSWPKSPWTSPSRIHRGGRGFQWCNVAQLEQQKRCGFYSCDWKFDSFRFIPILHPAEKGNKLKCLRDFVHEWSTLVWYLQVWFSRTLSQTRYHACIWCKCMPNTSTCTAFWFWLIALRAKAFKCSRMKNVGKSKVLAHERVFQKK